ERPGLDVTEKPPRVLDGRPEAALSGHCIARATEYPIGAVSQRVAQVGQWQPPYPGSCQLDAQRQSVYQAADLQSQVDVRLVDNERQLRAARNRLEQLYGVEGHSCR